MSFKVFNTVGQFLKGDLVDRYSPEARGLVFVRPDATAGTFPIASKHKRLEIAEGAAYRNPNALQIARRLMCT